MRIEAVFLDVGGIILEINWKLTLNRLGFTDPKSHEEVMEKVRKFQPLYDYERGQVSRREFFFGFADLLGLKDHPDLEDAFNQLIVGPLPQAETIFDEFSGRIPIYALSNTNECHHSYQIERFSILKRFDHFLTSYDLGHRKPDPEIYLAAAELMKVKPEQAVFIDDGLANVRAAEKLGFRAFQTVNSPEQTRSILRSLLT